MGENQGLCKVWDLQALSQFKDWHGLPTPRCQEEPMRVLHILVDWSHCGFSALGPGPVDKELSNHPAVCHLYVKLKLSYVLAVKSVKVITFFLPRTLDYAAFLPCPSIHRINFAGDFELFNEIFFSWIYIQNFILCQTFLKSTHMHTHIIYREGGR